MQIGANSRRNIWWVSPATAEAALKPRMHADAEIAEAAAHALRWRISSGGVRAAVDKGWVTLSGQVTTASEKAAAEKAVYYLLGVKGIRNDVTIKPPGKAMEVVRRLEAVSMMPALEPAAGS
jgi:osmotically-inducible protein OsmY